MKERYILREIRGVLNVNYDDIPKTLIRFKKEIEEMKKELGES